MRDVTTDQVLKVSHDGSGGPYIMVPVEQLPAVKQLLTGNRIPHWIDEDAISLDGKPEIAVINLGHRANAASVQQLLDQQP